jgi:type I restriction enzyme S subunit
MKDKETFQSKNESTTGILKNKLSHGWEIKKLGDVCEFKSGNTIDIKLEKNNGNILYAKVGDMNLRGNEYYITLSSRYVNLNEINNNQIIPIGSIVFPKRGGAIATNKKRRIVKPTIVDLNIMALIPSKTIDKDYLFFWFLQIDLADLSNGTSIPQINNYSFDNIYISFPKNIQEQQHIVSILEETFFHLTNAKTNAEQNLKNAKELFESYLQNVFANKGEGWGNKKINEITKVINGYSFDSKDFSSKNLIKSVKITNVGVQEFIEETNNYLPEKFKDNLCDYQVNEGDIVIALTRTIISTGLKVATVPKSYNGALLNQRVAALSPNNKLINQRYLYYFLSTNIVSNYVKAHVNTLMQPNLSINDLKNLLVPCPPLITQNSIIQKLDILSIQCKKLESIYQKKVIALDELKKSILQKAFSGQLS